MEELLTKYTNYFKKLNRGYSKGLGKAPHKPILLLSVMELMAKGEISINKIFITGELVLAFKNNWQKLVTTGHTPNFSLPFFHLKNEPFWELETRPGMELPITKSRSIKSFPKLKETVAFACLEEGLFALLLTHLYRQILTEVLLDTYFPETKGNFSLMGVNATQQQLEYELLNEPGEIYREHLKQLKATLKENEFLEEVFVRGSLFKKTVPRIYEYTCCISGMKINTHANIQMVDACHIRPFSLSNDDTIPNGISLSPNLHRAFDRGLICINKDYRVEVSPDLTESESVYGLRQFDGVAIRLPEKKRHYPSPEGLAWHREQVFLGEG